MKIIFFVIFVSSTFLSCKKINNYNYFDNVEIFLKKRKLGVISRTVIDTTFSTCIKDTFCLKGFDNEKWKEDSLGILDYRERHLDALRLGFDRNNKAYYYNFFENEILSYLGKPNFIVDEDDRRIFVYHLFCNKAIEDEGCSNLYIEFNNDKKLMSMYLIFH